MELDADRQPLDDLDEVARGICGGSNASVDPVPRVKPEIRPLKTCLWPYMSTYRSAAWPMRKSRSCVSLKLASTQISLSERIAIKLCPT